MQTIFLNYVNSNKPTYSGPAKKILIKLHDKCSIYRQRGSHLGAPPASAVRGYNCLYFRCPDHVKETNDCFSALEQAPSDCMIYVIIMKIMLLCIRTGAVQDAGDHIVHYKE